MAKTVKTFITTGYVDSCVLYHEYGETSGALEVYATVEELAANNPCVAETLATGDGLYPPVKVTITYTVETGE
jgi:hypothetical protein